MTPRLRILELPTRAHPDGYLTPFVLVLDRAADADVLLGDEAMQRLAAAAERMGADATLVFPGPIDLPQAHRLLARVDAVLDDEVLDEVTW